GPWPRSNPYQKQNLRSSFRNDATASAVASDAPRRKSAAPWLIKMAIQTGHGVISFDAHPSREFQNRQARSAGFGARNPVRRVNARQIPLMGASTSAPP